MRVLITYYEKGIDKRQSCVKDCKTVSEGIEKLMQEKNIKEIHYANKIDNGLDNEGLGGGTFIYNTR